MSAETTEQLRQLAACFDELVQRQWPSAQSHQTSVTASILCPRCRASYNLRETSDFRKLVTLSQTGRSTATTIIGAGAILGLRNDPGILWMLFKPLAKLIAHDAFNNGTHFRADKLVFGL